MRTLIFHYHLFKNAGTSVDEMLRKNFGARWVQQEFLVPRRANAAAVVGFLSAASHLDAVSSHTALLPAPKIAGVDIFPILFVRHPIDRLRSAYEFERNQHADTLGARLAKEYDFAGYLRELLKNKRHRQVRNFQTLRLSHAEPTRNGSEAERAARALSRLPFVGLVEDFDVSLARLERLLRAHFPDFKAEKTHRNISRPRAVNLDERIAAIEARLGTDLYAEICDANADDMALYATLERRFDPERKSDA